MPEKEQCPELDQPTTPPIARGEPIGPTVLFVGMCLNGQTNALLTEQQADAWFNELSRCCKYFESLRQTGNAQGE